MNREKNNANRGAALLSVVIVVSVVVILATLILSVSYTNLSMKVVDKKSTDNFYSAEKVLDEVCAGIQQEISAQYKAAYTTIMENYGTYTTSAEMKEEFNVEFVLNMVGALKNGTNTSSYDLTKLSGYVSADYPVGAVCSVSCVTDKNRLDTLEDGLSIRNLVVSYQNGSYVDTITTDIKILIPEVYFSLISNMPEIAEYACIADSGITLSASAFWSVKGKAYAGIQDKTSTATDNTAVLLNAGSSLKANDSDTILFVSQGDVKAIGGSVFQTGSATSFWAESVTAVPSASGMTGANLIKLLGRSYIKDDVTLNGSTNTLALGGQYYGYSNNDTNAALSSAIIINGQSTTLDMSDLDTLVLAGSSFIATAGETYDSLSSVSADANTKDVLMGDSVAVKTNQLAYMVPTECVGIKTNPMSYSDYLALTSDSSWEEKALNTTISGLNRKLNSYGNVSIVPVFTNKSGGAVYLYLEFLDSKVASEYFMDYYENTEEGQKLQKYLKNYLAAITFNSDASKGDLGLSRLVTQGNYLVPATYANGAWTATYEGNTGDIANIAQEVANYGTSFKALCTKLVTNMTSVTSEEAAKTVYENIVDEDAIAEFFKAYQALTDKTQISSNVTFESLNSGKTLVATITALNESSGDTVKAVIVDNKDDSNAYVVNASTMQSGILIATGDVQITGSAVTAWNGVVICKGTLTLSNGTDAENRVLRNDPDAVGKAMQLICSIGATEVKEENTTENYAVLNFFKGGANFTLGGSSSAENAKVDVRECISFENWKAE